MTDSRAKKEIRNRHRLGQKSNALHIDEADYIFKSYIMNVKC